MTARFARRTGAAAACGIVTALVITAPAMADSTRNRQWHLTALNVTAAQKVSKGAGVTVAVIDTGVKADHRDLTGNVLPGIDLVATGTKGWVDTNGHGTAMAGLIAGHGHGPGHADGVLGIAPAAKVLPIRALRTDGKVDEDIPKAIDEAVRRHVGVISMSFTAGGSSTDLDRALEDAAKADVVLIAGSGNRPDNVLLQYPAKSPVVVAVGATTRAGKLSEVTVTGKEMRLSAPGEEIVSTSNTGQYEFGDGTSASTAIVAGAAALIRSKYPDLSATEVVHRLTATATDKGAPGRDSDYGFGELNLVAALTADVPAATPSASAATTPPTSAASAEAAPPAGSAMRIDWVAVGVALASAALVVVLIGWFIMRSRRRRPSTGSPGPGRYQPPDQRAGDSQHGTFRP
jgi:type VII secretion-associated serine protease mycosin